LEVSGEKLPRGEETQDNFKVITINYLGVKIIQSNYKKLPWGDNNSKVITRNYDEYLR
jgi:hypothetical protein